MAEIGERAKIVVKSESRDNEKIVKYASAHDLRRSFGQRWASRVMPQILMELMRHESIDTTMRFYVGRNAQTTAAVLWKAHAAASSNDFGNGSTSGGKVSVQKPPENSMRPLGLEPKTYGLKVRCSTN